MGFFIKSNKHGFGYREGFLIVTLGWILASVFGAIPFYIAGTFDSFLDAFFETVSGYTTTGASVLSNIEVQPHGILFWRAFTHWIGGMGILVFTLALLPAIGMGTVQIFKAESPGPNPEKIVPKIKHTAIILYGIYFVISLLEVIALKLAGMSLFDAFTHTFATMGTGGFSTRNASIGAFESPAIHWIIIFFMFLAGVNFSLYFSVLRGKFKTLIKDSEFRFYFFTIIIAAVLIFLSISNIGYVEKYGVEKTARDSIFQTLTIITTTGFATVDYDKWPDFTKMIMFILMFVGGSSGSTGGSIKCIRILLLFKFAKREMYKLIHPRSVIPIRIGNTTVNREVMRSVIGLVILFVMSFIGISLILLAQGMDLMSSTSATIACLGNIGPGFAMVGPTMNFADLTNLSKIVLSIAMIMGRLEIYTVLVMFVPVFWKD